jgi:hypothetical protein
MSNGGADKYLRGRGGRGGVRPASRVVSPILAVALALTAAITNSGCWLMALQLAPIALSAAGDVGSGVEYAAASAAGKVEGKHEDVDNFGTDENLPGGDELDSNDSCQLLEAQTPGVIEIRKSTSGAPEYRALKLSDSSGGVRWTPVVDEATATDGWRPAVRFLSMSFTPPLTNAILPNGSSYVAYAPAQSQTSAEQDQLTALHFDFGNTVGTFNWDGRLYQYAVAHALPCMPPPS